MNLHDRFEQVNEEYIKFDNVVNKLSVRPDVHAFILLEQFGSNEGDLICHSGHDEIYLSIRDDDLKNITDDQIIELVRCGVRHDEDSESLCMFV